MGILRTLLRFVPELKEAKNFKGQNLIEYAETYGRKDAIKEIEFSNKK